MEYPTKDFSYILRPDIYHPLTQLETPPAFRDLSLNPAPSTPLPELLSTGQFRPAAITAAQLLTNSTSPSDYVQIFQLFYVRLICLTLINATPLAAQEAKALEDLGSSFYRHPISHAHLVPWELRVLAVRLQGIGFADARRGIMGYYDLASDARSEILTSKDNAERDTWKARLEDLGIRVANTLVEMGDLEGAGRHLESLRVGPVEKEQDQLLRARLILLNLRIGDLTAARAYMGKRKDEEDAGSPYISALEPLFSMAEGNYSDAISQLSTLENDEPSAALQPLYAQNLAVFLLYNGEIAKARSLLESLISSGHSFPTLIFNLSTIFELCTDRSRSLKMALAEKIAKRDDVGDGVGRERGNVDFKL
ncbi:MAG: hypothetical protein Q9187_003567 [Circinaria calcarea]